MRFLVDECTGPAVAQWLREQQHNVFSVYEEARGMQDDDVIRLRSAGVHSEVWRDWLNQHRVWLHLRIGR